MNIDNKIYESCKNAYHQILTDYQTRIEDLKDSIAELEKTIETTKEELIEAAKSGDSERYAIIRNEKEMAEIRINSERQELSSLLEKETLVNEDESKEFHNAIKAEMERIGIEANREIMVAIGPVLETWKKAYLTMSVLNELENNYVLKVDKKKHGYYPSSSFAQPDSFKRIERLGDLLYPESFEDASGIVSPVWKKDMKESFSDELKKINEATR